MKKSAKKQESGSLTSVKMNLFALGKAVKNKHIIPFHQGCKHPLQASIFSFLLA
jgi:hypothetical protein